MPNRLIRRSSVEGVSQAIDDLFANSPYPTKTESEAEFMLSFACRRRNCACSL
jgi:hypothetical protein